MEPVTSIVSAIFKVLQEITKAEREARRNRTRCRELAGRAEVVSSVLRDARTVARNDAASATRRMVLCRLRDALNDALKLVQACGRREGGRLLSRITSLLQSGARGASFDDVDKRISNCLIELNAASSACIEKKVDGLAAVSANDHHRPSTKKSKEAKARNTPQKGKGGQNGGKSGKDGGKGGKKKKGKKKNEAARPLFQPNRHGYAVHHHSFEDDPTSCSVM